MEVKKRSFLILTLILVAGFMLSACSEAKQVSKDDSLEKVKQAGKFIVGLDDTFAPMGFRDESGNIVGFDIDLAKEAAKRLGVEVEFKPIDWNSKELELKNRKIDMIWNGLTITEDRKKNMAFTKPYLVNTQIIIVPEGSSIKSKADLAGKKVGVQISSSSLEALKKDKEVYESLAEVVEYPDNLEALLDLKAGRIDAVVADEILGRYYIEKRKENFVVLDDNFGTEEYGVGLRLEDKALLEALDKVLDEMKQDGTMSEISKKWFGEDIIKK
ncbi:amino acid ABC transporter substrate-binding protein [Caldicoprobacter guelmensis]|uniref:amino acid ABC transporter substrate-binding protein n=1 Tax=Caldicoprobacter guelmensis TaxID=1170224 RepID=UPI001A9C3831